MMKSVCYFLLLLTVLTDLESANGEVYCKDHGCDGDKCLPKSWVCDGSPDCDDGTDEAFCYTLCTEGEFRCTSGACIAMSWRCDGHDDCKDGSDENNCSQIVCGRDKYSCPNSTICIDYSSVCDGNVDCPYGYEEAKQACEDKICPGDSLKCNGGSLCVPRRWVCNHEVDCEDGSDEVDCPTTPVSTCAPDEFQCVNMECISKFNVCDSFKDCLDGSDEDDCGRDDHDGGDDDHDDFTTPTADICTKNNGGCAQVCINTHQGVARCRCMDGYHLMENGVDCQDTDECKNQTACSQLCLNRLGSYECSCMDGFHQDPLNHTKCHITEKPMGYAILIAILSSVFVFAVLALMIWLVLRKLRSLNSRRMTFHQSSSLSPLKDDHLSEIISTTKVNTAQDDEENQLVST